MELLPREFHSCRSNAILDCRQSTPQLCLTTFVGVAPLDSLYFTLLFSLLLFLHVFCSSAAFFGFFTQQCNGNGNGCGVFWLGFARICVGFSFQFLFQLSEMCIAIGTTTGEQESCSNKKQSAAVRQSVCVCVFLK